MGSIDENIHQMTFKKGSGCQNCNQTGYRGRVGVFELLEMTEPMMNALKAGDTVLFGDVAQQSPNYAPLSHVALTYAKMGITTVEEVLKLVEMVSEVEPQERDTEEHEEEIIEAQDDGAV